MKYAYNYHVTDTVTQEEVAWGTFTSEQKLDPVWELRHRAKQLANALFTSHDLHIEICECDLTSGDFQDIGGAVASYTTKEN